jgi:hypothetical protein
VHPIEHLRYVARARGADANSLVRESAMALGSLRADHRDLVIACRRIVERHPGVGPLWWMAARLLTADDPARLAWELADEIDEDHVPRAVAERVPDASTVVTIGWPETAGEVLMRRPDVRVLCADAAHEASSFMQRLERVDVECEPVPSELLARAVAAADVAMIDAAAACDSRILAPVGSHVLAAVAASVGTPVWLVAGVGRRLPGEYVEEIANRLAVDSGWDVELDDVPLALVSHVATIEGVHQIAPSGLRADAPFAPELLRTSAI